MKNVVVFDAFFFIDNVITVIYTRPISHIRIGIDTIFEKWQALMPDASLSPLTVPYLQKKFATTFSPDDDNFFVAGHVIPTKELAVAALALNRGEAIVADGTLLAYRGSKADFEKRNFASTTTFHGSVKKIFWLYDIFMMNGDVMLDDFRRITAGRTSQPLSSTNLVIGNPTFDDGSPRIFICLLYTSPSPRDRG